MTCQYRPSRRPPRPRRLTRFTSPLRASVCSPWFAPCGGRRCFVPQFAGSLLAGSSSRASRRFAPSDARHARWSRIPAGSSTVASPPSQECPRRVRLVELVAHESLPRGRSGHVLLSSRLRYVPPGRVRPAPRVVETFVTGRIGPRVVVVSPPRCGQRSARCLVTSETMPRTVTVTSHAPPPSRHPPSPRSPHRHRPANATPDVRAALRPRNEGAPGEERTRSGPQATAPPGHVTRHDRRTASVPTPSRPPTTRSRPTRHASRHRTPQALATEERGSDPQTPNHDHTCTRPHPTSRRRNAPVPPPQRPTPRPATAPPPTPPTAPQTLTTQSAEPEPQRGRERGTSEHRERPDARPVDVHDHTRGSAADPGQATAPNHAPPPHQTPPAGSEADSGTSRHHADGTNTHRQRRGRASGPGQSPTRGTTRQPSRERPARSPVTKSRADVSMSRLQASDPGRCLTVRPVQIRTVSFTFMAHHHHVDHF